MRVEQNDSSVNVRTARAVVSRVRPMTSQYLSTTPGASTTEVLGFFTTPVIQTILTSFSSGWRPLHAFMTAQREWHCLVEVYRSIFTWFNVTHSVQ